MSTVIDEAPGPSPSTAGSPKTRDVRPARPSRTWRFPTFAFSIALIALVGLLVFMYPSTANWVSQYHQAQVIRAVDGVVEQGPASRLLAELDRARAYNSALVGGALIEAGTNVPSAEETESGGLAYGELLNADALGTMGRLRIPSIGSDLPIAHGTSDAVLERGVGHLRGTALPVGGTDRHSVLTAHRGLASSELFDRLDQVEVDDTFTIEVFGEVLTYRVITTQVVQPDETESLYPQAGRDLVTLVTCTPLGINTHRILVTGERISPTPPEDLARAGGEPEIPGFPWWAVVMGSAVVLLAGTVWRAGVVRVMNRRPSGSDQPYS